MVGRWNLLILVLHLCLLMVMSCPNGFLAEKQGCIDDDECDGENRCGSNTICVNTNGSFYCQCEKGFQSSSGALNFSATSSTTCKDINECVEDFCGPNAKCSNTIPNYFCNCDDGFISSTGVKRFHHGDNVTCREFNCDVFKDLNNLDKVASDPVTKLIQSCLNLTESEGPTELDGESILKTLLAVIDELLSSGAFHDNRKVSSFLNTIENTLRIIGPFIKNPGTKRYSNYTEFEMLVQTGADLPQGAVTLSTKQAKLDISLTTAAGDPSYYPGFTTVSLLNYGNLEDSAHGFFGGMKLQKNQRFKINSKVVTVTVSNKNTSLLKEPVKLTLYHLIKTNDSICVFWDSSEGGGSWSDRGCSVMESNYEYTVCSCNHLSSFAVLMALYEMEDTFELQLITWVGLSLSLISLFICILTFSLIRSIQSPRNTIHLHLCFSLFIATLIFLAGISRTKNQVGCAVVAALLHFFYLAAFCWMCLEGIQLFRMVVLVFNPNFKTLYMMTAGYGVPAAIVAISILANSKGYGTKRFCWLSLDLIWSFFGPVCVIIFINIFFFIITVWRLAQKFSSLNPDMNNLQKIKTFTITAVAQLCLLGITWIFGCFQFEKSTIAMSYLFTIFSSVQGVMLFVMHCLFSKQVREEYGKILSRFNAPQKKSYSEFGYSSKAPASRSSQNTGESHILGPKQ